MNAYRILVKRASKEEINFLVRFLSFFAFMEPNVNKENDWTTIDLYAQRKDDLKKDFVTLLHYFIVGQNKPEMESLLSKCKVLDTSHWDHTVQWPPIWIQEKIADNQQNKILTDIDN